MQFVIIGEDRENALAERQALRPRHLEFIKTLGEAFLAGGPFLDEQENPVGSMLVVEADNLEAAKAMAARDPYLVEGLFQTSSVRRWNWLFGNPGKS